MTRGFGSPYGKGKTYRPYGRAQLGVSIRRPDAPKPVLYLTPTRRGLLEAVEAHKVRYYPSHGWRCEGRTVNAIVQDCIRAGWVNATTQLDAASIALTDAGRAAIGLDEVSA